MSRKLVKLLEREAFELLDQDRPGAARRLVNEAIASLPDGEVAQKNDLLGVSFNIEMTLGRSKRALAILEKRRALGFRSVSESFDADLLYALLLARTGQHFSARVELTELLTNPKSLRWSGLLDALDAYVDTDQHCRRLMKTVLVRACSKSCEKLGIPAKPKGWRIERANKQSKQPFRLGSARHQELVMRTMAANTTDARYALMEHIKQSVDGETVGYFRQLAKGLHAQISGRMSTSLAPKKPKI